MGPFSYLGELDHADDLRLALLLHINSQIHEATRRLIIFAKEVALNISDKKTEVMALNTTNSPVQVENEDIHYT